MQAAGRMGLRGKEGPASLDKHLVGGGQGSHLYLLNGKGGPTEGTPARFRKNRGRVFRVMGSTLTLRYRFKRYGNGWIPGSP
jgi:hypothetical protein